MGALTGGEKILLFAILGLFAAAGLVRMEKNGATGLERPPTAAEIQSLHEIAKQSQTVDPESVRRTTLRIASNPAAKTEDRALAITICGRLGLASALPLCRRIVRAENEDASIKVSAIRSMAALGDPNDRAALRELAAGKDTDLKRAAQSALAQFRDHD